MLQKSLASVGLEQRQARLAARPLTVSYTTLGGVTDEERVRKDDSQGRESMDRSTTSKKRKQHLIKS